MQSDIKDTTRLTAKAEADAMDIACMLLITDMISLKLQC